MQSGRGLQRRRRATSLSARRAAAAVTGAERCLLADARRWRCSAPCRAQQAVRTGCCIFELHISNPMLARGTSEGGTWRG